MPDIFVYIIRTSRMGIVQAWTDWWDAYFNTNESEMLLLERRRVKELVTS